MAEGTPTRTVVDVMSAPPVTAVPSETLAARVEPHARPWRRLRHRGGR